jgi:hypothetical protein
MPYEKMNQERYNIGCEEKGNTLAADIFASIERPSSATCRPAFLAARRIDSRRATFEEKQVTMIWPAVLRFLGINGISK